MDFQVKFYELDFLAKVCFYFNFPIINPIKYKKMQKTNRKINSKFKTRNENLLWSLGKNELKWKKIKSCIGQIKITLKLN